MSTNAFTISGDTVPRVTGSVLGLAGFVTVLGSGLIEGNPAAATLGRGLVCLVICAVIGRLLGWAGLVAAGEVVERYRSEHPEPSMPEQLVRIQQKKAQHEDVVKKMQDAA
ncbi:MAG: hypothetical protein AAGA55_03105 [Planctomycetota bacterium]